MSAPLKRNGHGEDDMPLPPQGDDDQSACRTFNESSKPPSN